MSVMSLKMFSKNFLNKNCSHNCLKKFVRCYAVLNRFYKNTSILKSEGKYEITLDQRKLKTPMGSLFTVDSEPLALAVAAEWNVQKKKIIQSKMHLTTLCNTVLDNPNNLTKYDIVNYIVNYLDTDTVLFQANEDDDLIKFQINEWDPVIEWFNKRFNVKLKKSIKMDVSPVSEEDKTTLIRHLMSHNFAAVNGFMYGVDTLKSVILTLAATEKHLTPEKAALLSRLEEEYQCGRWGRVEWAHDLHQQELQSRLSAVVLFAYFNTQTSLVQEKGYLK